MDDRKNKRFTSGPLIVTTPFYTTAGCVPSENEMKTNIQATDLYINPSLFARLFIT